VVALAATVAVVVVIAVALVAVLSQEHNANSASTTQTTTPAYSSYASSAAPTASTPPADPLQQLQQLAAQDESYIVVNLADRWVPQLSTKRPGVHDDGIVYDNAAILQEHLRLRQQYDAKLLWSTDWSNYDLNGYWVTIVASPSSDPGTALQWCSNHNLDDDHCFAERISKTSSRQGSTVHQH
jgi:serine/threonine-protein kinase